MPTCDGFDEDWRRVADARAAPLHSSPPTVVDAAGELISIGSAPDNTLCLDDGYAAPHHALLRRQGEGYLVDDLSSAGGTRLLHDVEFTAPRGTLTAVIGPSGAGVVALMSVAFAAATAVVLTGPARPRGRRRP